MKKKILTIILIILVILLVVFCTLKISKNNSSNKNENTSRNFILNSNTESKVNTHGENSGIYVGVNEKEKENFLFISIKINKKASKEEQVKSLISSISDSIGYKIDINSIEAVENKIKIDFANSAAPFELQNSYNSESTKKYMITNENFVAKTIFDSINKTLKSYFGEETEIYFSVNSENINIENTILTINIDMNKPYENQ